MKLNIEYLNIDSIKKHDKNAREHKDTDINAIAKSIKEFGFDDPIGIWSEENIIVEGHGRLLAAKKLGMETVPCIRLDHLSDEQRKAYALAHNKTAELSSWDFDLLKSEILDIKGIDMSDFGFDFQEPKEVEEDDVPDVPEIPSSHYGQVYQLGKHRLICGDATKLRDVEILMNGTLADLVVTDPPYNMSYNGAGNTKDRKSKRIMNDSMSNSDFQDFLHKAYLSYINSMKDGASFYTFYKELGTGVFINELERCGLNFKQELIWVKNQIVLGGAKYQSMYEPFLMACKGKRVAKWNGGRKQTSVIEQIDFMGEDELKQTLKEILNSMDTDILREKKQTVNDLHPTMKPVRLIARLIQNSSNAGDIVLDLFGGSGTTLIAAEQTGRVCYMSELDPRYVDVIIKRYEAFTGGTACLIADFSV